MTSLRTTLLGTAAALCLMATAAQAYTISTSETPTFQLLDLGTGTGNGTRQAGFDPGFVRDGITVNFTGASGVYSGSQSGLSASPFGDARNYLAAQPGGTLTLLFSSAQTALNLLWGTIDNYNDLTFTLSGSSGTETINGSALGLGSGTNTRYVSIAGLSAFNSVGVFSNSASAFEFAPGVAVPEPASLALFGAGLLGLGLVRRRKAASQV